MRRHCLTISLVLLLGLAAATPAQQELKDAFRGWQNRVDAIREKEKKDFEKIAMDLQRESERLHRFWLMLEAEIDLGESKLVEAATKSEQAVEEFEKQGPEKLAPKETTAYREALLQSGRLRAAMGDQEKGCMWARRAWEVHQRLPSARRPASLSDHSDAARTSLAVALTLHAGEQPDEAALFLQRAFDACQRLPETLRHPERNPLLAEAWLLKSVLANNAGNYSAARDAGMRAVAAFRALFPHKEGSLKLAAALMNLALAHVAQGESVEARPLLKDADDILKQQRGPVDLLRAELYRIRGHLHLQSQKVKMGKEDIEQARQQYEGLFPCAKYPKSHPTLIQALLSHADLLNHYGQRTPAIQATQTAVEHCQKRYPNGHQQYVASLLSSGRCLRDSGRLAEAERRFRQALAMAQDLDRAKPTPAGGLRVALAQIHLGGLLGRQGIYREAQELLRAAEAIYQKLSPDGHPHWFAATAYRGMLSLHHNDRDGAREAFATALDLDRRQLRHFARTVSDVEALTFNPPRQLVLHGYLSASRDGKNLDEESFDRVWSAHRAVTRLAEARRAALRLLRETNPEARRLLTEIGELAARLHRDQITAPTESTSEQEKRRDDLELKFSKFWPEAEKWFNEAGRGPRELSARLPRGCAFLDFIRYNELAESQVVRARYVAFLLLPGQSARRIELDQAEPIDRAIRDWRTSVDQWKPLADEANRAWEKQSQTQATKLRRLIWEKIAPLLLADTRLILLAPDGDLARFPFAALPGSRPQTILLHDFSLAYVPHGPYLLEQLLRAEDRAGGPDRFLAVGGVNYGRPRSEHSHHFNGLPGSRAVVQIGKRRAATTAACVLSDDEATVLRLRRELSEASEGHLATHGFFDEAAWNDDRRRVLEMFGHWSPQVEAPVGSLGLGQRFPLSYVGLVMAGANESKTRDDGVLSGEVISTLPLSRLRLIFLDGCQTGVGEYTAGEGVQGLARAFHLAGCSNVIATLWHVNDGVAKALTEEFYRQLWENKRPTLEALRQAQLALFHDPGRVRLLADHRGVPAGPAAEGLEIRLPSSSDRREQTSVHNIWGAAYVHSGIGHPFVDPNELTEQFARLRGEEAVNSPQHAAPDGEGPSAGTSLLLWGLGAAGALSVVGMLLLRRQQRSAGLPS